MAQVAILDRGTFCVIDFGILRRPRALWCLCAPTFTTSFISVMESPRLVGSSSHSQRAINWLAGQWRLHQKKMRSDGQVGAASKVAVDKTITEEMKSRLKKSEVLHQKLEQKVQELKLAFDGAFQLLKACGESMPKLKEVFDHAKDEMLQNLGEVTERVTGLSAKVCAAQADVDDIP